ncbi:MAG TPA: hypothetical protein VMJ10_04920 [Kofleriaceae bacterium]|nr:hypothetical protein [Kofleriaceae bacterium]
MLSVVAITLLAGHVAPSVDDNNRYLKLTPLGDRIRLAYTVFYGEVPGASERRAIDTNGDGQIDDAEARAFAAKLADQVAAALTVEVDGRTTPVVWTTIDPGMGTPVVAAGAFSVDLVAYFCFAKPRGRHRVVVHDRFRIPRPGETEAKVDDAPGVTIESAHVGAADDPTYDFRFAGPGGPLENDGLEVVLFAGKDAPVVSDGKCPSGAREQDKKTIGLGLELGLGLVALAATAGILLWTRRRRARPR